MFKLKLRNYRGFLDVEFNFSRVNILIGENSAGKSSILKFLLALKQSLLSTNSREYNLTLSDELADLGNYYETIYNHEIEKKLGFTFEFQRDYFDFFLKDAAYISYKNNLDETLKKALTEKRQEISNYLGGEITTPTTIEFELTNNLANHKNIVTKISNTSVGELSIIQPQIEQEIYVKGEKPLCSIIFKTEKETYTFSEIEYGKIAFMSIIDSESLKNKIKKEFENGKAEKLFWQIGFLLITQNYIQNLLVDIKYMNPLLYDQAQRVYLKRDEKINFNIKDIKEVVYLLSGDNFLKGKALESFLRKYTEVLAKFGIIDSINLNKTDFTRELRIIVNGMDNNIKDVGFGVSLQMPIFAQAMISENSRKEKNNQEIRSGETLLIEQPEVHLHPRLQAKFIDALLGIGDNNIYIIETHSEHIVRKLQVLVKEGKYNLSPESVSINYLRKEGKDMLKSYHNIDNEGILTPNFPKGFYDVSYNLAFDLIT
jgi:predicted ATPase